MPWTTPTLTEVRQNNAAYITGKLKVPVIPNGEVRVLADANAGNAHLVLQYLDWLALQLLPDTAEQQFLEKWANIYLVNADGSRGRKVATYASGTVTITGIAGTVFPQFSPLTFGSVGFETTQAVTVGSGATPVPVRALDAGSAGNLPAGAVLSIATAVAGISGTGGATVVSMSGGADQESDDELRIRVLDRIRQPPMGGDADDYVNWTLQVAGVTRAWSAPLEMGMGTVTVRFMCDDLRAANNGLPNGDDIAAVQSFLDTVRPVCVKDFFVVSPILQPVNFALQDLAGDSSGLRAAIASSVAAMIRRNAKPAYALNGVRQDPQTIYASMVSAAISATAGVTTFDLIMNDAVMANAGCMAILGNIS